MTPSCTAALEMAVRLSIEPGDEVILPSFGFASCANAVILAGGVPVFHDIDPMWLLLNYCDPSGATACVLPIHYAGVTQNARGLGAARVIEDAAHCIGDFRITGDFACLSFHETKNISCGQGGALIVRDEEMVERVQIMRHCGTTKAIVKHAWDWVDVGTQQLMNEVTAELLWRELGNVDAVTAARRNIWKIYRDEIRAEEKASHAGNGHIFWFLHPARGRVQDALMGRGIRLASHYTPLHSRSPGILYGRSVGECPVSTRVADQILRPPMNVSPDEARRIAQEINKEL